MLRLTSTAGMVFAAMTVNWHPGWELVHCCGHGSRGLRECLRDLCPDSCTLYQPAVSVWLSDISYYLITLFSWAFVVGVLHP
jgi:hypothetical protein